MHCLIHGVCLLDTTPQVMRKLKEEQQDISQLTRKIMAPKVRTPNMQ